MYYSKVIKRYTNRITIEKKKNPHFLFPQWNTHLTPTNSSKLRENSVSKAGVCVTMKTSHLNIFTFWNMFLPIYKNTGHMTELSLSIKDLSMMIHTEAYCTSNDITNDVVLVCTDATKLVRLK